MVIVTHQLDIVNYVDSIIFVDKSSRDVIKDTHDNLIYRNQNYKKLFGLKEEVHNG
jgi:sboT